MPTSVSETIYYVHDLDQAVEFYTNKFGWRLLDKQSWGWARLDVDGSARVGLMAESIWSEKGGKPAPRVSLQTTEIDAEYTRMQELGIKVGEMMGDGGQTRAFTFYDHDENAFFMWDDGSGKLTP